MVPFLALVVVLVAGAPANAASDQPTWDAMAVEQMSFCPAIATPYYYYPSATPLYQCPWTSAMWSGPSFGMWDPS